MQGIQVQLFPQRLDRQLLGDDAATGERSLHEIEQTLDRVSTLAGKRC